MKVLLIDDHPLILSALKATISNLEDAVTVVDVIDARSARAVLQQDSDFDLVLLDLRLGDADGFEVLSEFRSSYPALPVVVVSATDRASDVIRAIDLGAMGFVSKRANNETLFEALRMVLSGGIYVPPLDLGHSAARSDPLMDSVAGALRAFGEAASPDLLHEGDVIESLGLTPRQNEVLLLLLQGKPNKLIARDLKLSVETVKDHVAAVLRSLNVGSRTQAVLAISEMSRPPDSPRGRRKTDA